MSETEGPIKTPKQLLYAVLAAFSVPIVIIVLLTQYVGNLKNPSNASDAYTEEKVLERIAPIGSIRTEPVKVAAAADQVSLSDGADVQKANADPCIIDISAADNMMFNTNTIRLDSTCGETTLNFKHTGKLPANAGGHNVVIVESQNFDSVVSKIDMKLGEDSGYLPNDPQVLAKTGIIGGGQQITIKINTSKFKKGGDYTFLCSFPGHYSIMKGKVLIS
tara:strand:+ start:227 stop:886 length:660 start_codon:yes stop_codon:yes gene_type:complete